MEKTTDINSLPQSENTNNESNDLVNNIINEIKNNEENIQMTVDNNQQNMQMGPMEPPMYNPNLPPPPQDTMRFLPEQVEMDFKNNMDSNDDLVTKLINNLKGPIIVFFILLVMLLPILDKYLSKFVPKLYVNNNSLSYLGVLVKSIIGSLIFYLSTLI